MKRRFIDNLTSAQRKEFPMCTGVVDYAPDALAAVAHISYLGNEKHNKGQPLHHARGKSMDHSDCDLRHLSTRFDTDPAYADDVLAPVFHLAEHTWRALMMLQETMERVYGLSPAPAARFEGEPLDVMERVRARMMRDGTPPPPPMCAAVDRVTGWTCQLVEGHDGPHMTDDMIEAQRAFDAAAPPGETAEQRAARAAEANRLLAGQDRGEPEGMTRTPRGRAEVLIDGEPSAAPQCGLLDTENPGKACTKDAGHSGMHGYDDFDGRVEWHQRVEDRM